jgi:hypothetical protein
MPRKCWHIFETVQKSIIDLFDNLEDDIKRVSDRKEDSRRQGGTII